MTLLVGDVVTCAAPFSGKLYVVMEFTRSSLPDGSGVAISRQFGAQQSQATVSWRSLKIFHRPSLVPAGTEILRHGERVVVRDDGLAVHVEGRGSAPALGPGGVPYSPRVPRAEIVRENLHFLLERDNVRTDLEA